MSAYNLKTIKRGYYKLINPEKYCGDNLVNGLVLYRSGLELRAFEIFDNSSNILEWSSECVIVPYIAYDNKPHRYIVDVYIKKKMSDGIIKEFLAEIKPYDFLIPPKPKKRKTKKFLSLVENYSINKAKWEAAKKYAESKGWIFTILTEKDLYKK